MVKRVKKRRGLIDFLGSKKLISAIEEKIEKRLKLVMGTFEKNINEALKRLSIPTKGEVSALLSKIETLEARINKLEGQKGTRKPKTLRGKKE